MIIKNVTYKGVSLSDDNAKANHIVLIDETHGAKVRTSVYEKQNTHGVYTSNSFEGGRLFTFYGQVFGKNKEDRFIGYKILKDLLVVEAIPTETNRGFYDLSWEDDGGNTYFVKAKVYTKPEYSNGLDSPFVDFNFELLCEENTILSVIEKNSTGEPGHFGGVKLPVKLPAKLDNIVNDFTVINEGNYPAGCKLHIVGYAENPKISLGSRWFQVNAITTDLVIDSRFSKFIITDSGIDVSYTRTAGSLTPLVMPGNNVITFECDNLDPTCTISVTFNDTFDE